MEVKSLVVWAKSIKNLSREERLRFEPKRLPKIDAYIDMIIARGIFIQEYTVKMQKYMDEIQDALDKLASYGVKTPLDSKQTRETENPLRP